MDNTVKWYEMPVSLQFANIGSEVNRAIKWKKRNDIQKARNFASKAIDFLIIIKKDPKNKHRVGEIDAAIEELNDYFFGENYYQTTDEVLIRFYDSFLSSIYVA